MDMSMETLKKMAGFIEEKAKEIGVPVAFSAVDEGGNLCTSSAWKEPF